MDEQLRGLIAEYSAWAVSHGNATNEGNPEVANRSHDELMRVFGDIRSFAEEGAYALLSLTASPNEAVRCWAATHSLRYDSARAERVLEELGKGDGPIAFDAEMVLSEWKGGTLEIP